jgi:hypothetical protein
MALYPGSDRSRLPSAGIVVTLALAIFGLLWLLPQPDPPTADDSEE